MSDRPVNFSPGPAILPLPVLEEASQAVMALDEVGLSILEISHRSPPFIKIYEEARDGLKRLLGVPDSHDVLFLQGGARGQFAMVPLNFLHPDRSAAYVQSGSWSKHALNEATPLGAAAEVVSTEDAGFKQLPATEGLELPADCAYAHTTSNNTIVGTQYQTLPDFGDVPHVCDMSSDILSRPFDVGRIALTYAGAQKNAGPAGVTVVIIDKAFMETGREDIPPIWQYRRHSKKESAFNTPPVFSIYCVGLVVKWLESNGGIEAIALRNEAKAQLVYDTIDGSDGYYRAVVAQPEHRSRMNVTWRMTNEDLEKRFVAEATASRLNNLKGHRSVGGLRASIYNAMPDSGVHRLVEFMADFKRKHS